MQTFLRDTLSVLDVRMGHTFLLHVLTSLLFTFLLCKAAQDKPESILTVSPSWLSPGASVTLSCEVKPPSAGWRFYWYKLVPDLVQKNSAQQRYQSVYTNTYNYKYELIYGGTEQNSYIIDEQRHTAGYSCRAKKGNPEVFNDYSEPKFVWSADSELAASLTVSPENRTLLTGNEVSVNCGETSAEWRCTTEQCTGVSLDLGSSVMLSISQYMSPS
ncbi:uncharacterized protein LOC106530169 [Austrofundulus limnaeus]|uniref:Uncharacterized protein LOC106530169 n=1 Tax=Austrofundulus limnaeus TaxID=52670 RepID=A0A2I4CMH6_AUSLI|nr:PREDICTED: uncharacterized protein LOC106530169 [Austrofundulus limnaeus]